MSKRTASAPLVVWKRSIAACHSVLSPSGAFAVKIASGTTWNAALAPLCVVLTLWSRCRRRRECPPRVTQRVAARVGQHAERRVPPGDEIVVHVAGVDRLLPAVVEGQPVRVADGESGDDEPLRDDVALAVEALAVVQHAVDVEARLAAVVAVAALLEIAAAD